MEEVGYAGGELGGLRQAIPRRLGCSVGAVATGADYGAEGPICCGSQDGQAAVCRSPDFGWVCCSAVGTWDEPPAFVWPPFEANVSEDAIQDLDSLLRVLCLQLPSTYAQTRTYMLR